MRLHWHRRDLRLPDNVGLAKPEEPPAGAFVFDESVLKFAAAPRVVFMVEALEELRRAYRERGSDLLVRRGEPSACLVELLEAHDFEMVTWNRDYSGLARRRDGQVARKLEATGVNTASYHDALCHEPGSIMTNEGTPYQVFSYFWRKWRDRPKDAPRPIPQLASVEDDESIPTTRELGFEPPAASIQTAGTTAARDRLETFLDGAVFEYERAREKPAEGGTSRLSPHLKFGTIGIREVDDELRAALAETDGEARSSVQAFRRQLAWRDFYGQVLYFYPGIVSENYRDFGRELEWENDPALMDAWRRGRTGYPIVDAGMRQLLEEGHMHNRARMITACFLTKDLLVDWRHGYHHFRRHLVDHDTANDVSGWQWAASTGTDAQPYFRIFNPMTQGERYDPEARYITRYVTELDGVEPKTIHGWHECTPERRHEVAPEYPAPIVDHDVRRKEAITMFERARGTDESHD